MELPQRVRRDDVTVDCVRLAVYRTGPPDAVGPVIVLAHGLTDDASCWGRTARRLAQRHEVVSYDARGHGASDRADDYSAEAHTHDLVGLVRVLRLERPLLVGHSMGGVHAVLAALRVDVTGLVLEDPAWSDSTDDATKDVGASRRRVVEAATLPSAERWALGRRRHPDWEDDDLRAWVEAQPRVDPDVVDWFRSWPTTHRWREHVTGLACPGLLLIGDLSAVTPRAAEEARALWPALQVVQVRGAGHDVRRDRSDACWSAGSAFTTSRLISGVTS